ncbi:MAG TPA: hypothetical protein VH165_08585 [Kofleriaceae bacterium]|jgi:hypothetical protein|nr:hypothetical protein [Kofleriaceae bacterium]
MKRALPVLLLLVILTRSSPAAAGFWLELLRAPCWTGDASKPENNGKIKGSIDCFNKDFNGAPARTVLSLKGFQPWEYGFVFFYYDITGPFNDAGQKLTIDEKGGFFGGTTIAISPKKIAEKNAGHPFDWGPIADVSVKYEMEHVSKLGMLNYYGLNWDLKLDFMDFASVTTVIRDDRSLSGVDLQLGAAWQKSFSLGGQDFMFLGFFQWGVFGEGTGHQYIVDETAAPGGGVERIQVNGNSFFLSQPEFLWDFGKLVHFTPAKLYLGFEYQLAYHRYLIPDKTENVLQGMVRWNI